jgi:hypothetical protein
MMIRKEDLVDVTCHHQLIGEAKMYAFRSDAEQRTILHANYDDVLDEPNHYWLLSQDGEDLFDSKSLDEVIAYMNETDEERIEKKAQLVLDEFGDGVTLDKDRLKDWIRNAGMV